jgi:hypothetical protein
MADHLIFAQLVMQNGRNPWRKKGRVGCAGRKIVNLTRVFILWQAILDCLCRQLVKRMRRVLLFVKRVSMPLAERILR